MSSYRWLLLRFYAEKVLFTYKDCCHHLHQRIFESMVDENPGITNRLACLVRDF